ncbi:MAG: hypothetical protein SFU27_13955 [Thermonemataceae bacterium]|nr:hypothetical protein [Thermonemataceae bacterium]
MKLFIIFFLLCLQNIAQAQDTLLIEHTSKNPRIPLRNRPIPWEYERDIDTTKSSKVDYYFPYIFFHKDSVEIKEVSFEELKKMKVLSKKQLSILLDKISEKERIEDQKESDRIKMMEMKESILLPEPRITKAYEKINQYLMSSKLFLVVKDEKTQRAKIIPVKPMPDSFK